MVAVGLTPENLHCCRRICFEVAVWGFVISTPVFDSLGCRSPSNGDQSLSSVGTGGVGDGKGLEWQVERIGGLSFWFSLERVGSLSDLFLVLRLGMKNYG
ncbi:hypothetical protein JCGZ_01812 [Jatropha curcas]|uniref:Uncharacterized protein n=1 Tax=Jatropha curcas TaxID=180498 RepID=A0A067JRW5_JATCU|nr:hypothetical protein JCGZ_01812 [Jatropha curcas]